MNMQGAVRTLILAPFGAILLWACASIVATVYRATRPGTTGQWTGLSDQMFGSFNVVFGLVSLASDIELVVAVAVLIFGAYAGIATILNTQGGF